MIARMVAVLACGACTVSAFIAPTTLRIDSTVKRTSLSVSRAYGDHDGNADRTSNIGFTFMAAGGSSENQHSRREVMSGESSLNPPKKPIVYVSQFDVSGRMLHESSASYRR